MTKLLFLSGSIRKDSLNTKLANQAYNVAKDFGVETKLVNLKEFSMPIYDGDLEAESGLPENAKKLKQIFVEHDGFFIASPEYNSSFSALLKNSIDWISRPHEENEGSLIAFKGKVAAISAASPGALGGLRGLVPLRMLLSNIGVIVTPSQLALSNALNAFDVDGNLKDEKQMSSLKAVVEQFIEISKKQKGS